MDPAEKEDLENKKRANMILKREIEAQIEEKRRRKKLEEEIQELDNYKVESEAREQQMLQQQSNQAKKLQPQYKNLEKMFNLPQEKDERASVLQGESNRYDKDSQTARTNATESRATEVYKAIQHAELLAAEEKHKRLLKKLQRGGHDTRQLERKFAELKARLTGVPMQQQQIREIEPEERFTNKNDIDLEEKKRQAKFNQIFQMREKTANDIPAELSEDNIRQLLKKYV